MMVVVDGLGHVDVRDRILLRGEELGDAVRGGSGVVATHGHEEFDVVVLEQGEVEVLLEILVGGLETAHLQVTAAPVEVGVCLEEVDVLGARALGEQAAVTAVQADYPVTFGKERLRHGHHDRVHARSRAASAEDDDGIFHDMVCIALILFAAQI